MTAGNNCLHQRLAVEPCDQTVGVLCHDCNTLLAYCWMDEHIPESLWNRLAAQVPTLRACEQNRDDVCGICSENIL